MSKPGDFFHYRGGKLSVEDLALDEIAGKFGTPSYVYSAQALLAPLKELQKHLAPVDHLVCFAVKASSNVAILRLLADAGAGVDLVSGGELFRAGKAGVRGDRIVFSGVGKTRAEMEQALSYPGGGILSFNIESVDELRLLDSVAGEMRAKAPASFRFNPDVNARTHPYISTGLKKNKFGLNRKEILAIARAARDFPNIRIVGLSVHIGSQLVSLSPLEEAFRHAKSLLEELNALLPVPLTHLDLGGGIGITYLNEKPPSVAKYCALVLKHFGPKAKLKRPIRLLFEPGRMIAGNAGALVTRVLFRKERPAKDFLVVDAGMNDLIRPALYESHHEIWPVSRSAGKKSRRFDVVGPVCESADCFATDRNLPDKTASGDLLAILSAGAYGFTMASNYNSRPRAAEILVEGDRARVIRDRETYDDLVRGERL